MVDYKDMVEVVYYSLRGEICVLNRETSSLVFSIDSTEVEDDLDLQNATDDEITEYVLEHYSQEIQDLVVLQQ